MKITSGHIMGEHKHHKERKSIILLRFIGPFVSWLGVFFLLYGVYSAITPTEYVHSILLAVFAKGMPSWIEGVISFMSFGVYGCLMYVFYGAGHAVHFRLHGHKWNEIIEGANWK